MDYDENPRRLGCPIYISLGPLTGMTDGIYRVSLSCPEEQGYIVQTAKRVNPATEARRLNKLANKPKHPARTRKPGIQGYQEAENMSAAAQEARWAETQQFAALLGSIQP